MVRVLLLSLGVISCVGCQLGGAQTLYGVSKNDMIFGEVDLVLVDKEEATRVQSVPFVLFGQGTLPEEFGPDRQTFQRTSVGEKVRYPFRLAGGRIILYVEAGGMISYYQADAIDTPWELEVLGGGGAQLNLGKGWGLDLAARARQPTGNGNNHDEPSHAPHGTAGEFLFGLKKDF